MTAYSVALVRFDGGSRVYPVNGDEGWSEGSRVVVRMNWDGRTELARAEVVGRSFSRKPCRHSIACAEEVAEDYGTGPSGVVTRADLDRYMRHVRTAPVECFSCDSGGYPLEQQDWTLTYMSRFAPPVSEPFGEDQNWLTSFGNRLVMGPAGIGICRTWNGTQMFRTAGRKLGITQFSATVLDPSQDDIYRRFAERVEGSLVHPVVREKEDTTIDQIRSAIGGDSDGPVYLSDGVWL